MSAGSIRSSGLIMGLDQLRGGCSSVFRGCAAEHEAEVRLRERADRFRSLADQAPAMMRGVDASSFCTFLDALWHEAHRREPLGGHDGGSDPAHGGSGHRRWALGVPELWLTLVDTSCLKDALLNLCIGARNAMPDGRMLAIRTANLWLDRPAVRQHGLSEGPSLSLGFNGAGTGMSPAVVAKTFDPFLTTKPLGEGTGRGLSMTYRLAGPSGRQVQITSEQGSLPPRAFACLGTRGEGPADDEEVTAAKQTRSKQGEAGLIVDHEPTVRMLIRANWGLGSHDHLVDRRHRGA